MINKKWRGMGTLDWHTKIVKWNVQSFIALNISKRKIECEWRIYFLNQWEKAGTSNVSLADQKQLQEPT